MRASKRNVVIPDETIIRKIYIIRGQKVMLDFDLAGLYEVETRRLNEQVKRNIDRFPKDFMFRLNANEWQCMMSQIATSYPENVHYQSIEDNKTSLLSQEKRKISSPPFAFTEHGVTMLASILKSERAIKMSIAVVRAFIELKRSVLQMDEIVEQLTTLKEHLGEHDKQLHQIYTAIENLLKEKVEEKTWDTRVRIGYKQ
ncbi:MAG: ORF6N domain-containing protein [Chitinophagaceae bacterium]|nr:ORF6N domain-containing protein [Chitinophagaceae bacterium]